MSFHPYLFFGGNCRAAFTRYQEVFGGELVLITFADMPGDDPTPSGSADKIAHAALKLADGLLMGSDDPTTADFGPVQGMQVNCDLADVDEADRVFSALADGGQVTAPIGPTSWSPKFGMCIDRFGTPWMISANVPAG